MTPERWLRIKSAFTEALGLPDGKREAFLLSISGADVGLRNEVTSLLAAHSEEFLEAPLVLESLEPSSIEGREIGELLIGKQIGSGGRGEVYEATVVATGEKIAVKRFAGDSFPDPKETARFRQEARAAMALRHPNAVSVRGLLEWEGESLILMDLVEGRTLRQILTERRLSTPESLDYSLALSEALVRAHELGIIHRDVKPENVMVTADGRVKLLDFGTVKLVEPRNLDEAPTPDARSLSREGVVLGSASYMSPEQIQALPVDGRSDVFSLGALLYEMVTGRKAFDGTTILEVVSAVLRDDPPPPGFGALDETLRRALSKDPERRIDSMAAFRNELTAIRQSISP